MTSDTAPVPAVRAGRREWIGLAVLALPALLLAMDTTVLHLALPVLGTDLEAGSVQQMWIMDVYAFMVAGFLVTMGTLGDRIGRRKLLLIGAAAFATASVLAAFAPTAATLILARALLGVAGATVIPSTLSLISNMFTDPKQRASAIGLWMTCFSVGAMIGPVVGGVMLETFWWGSVFLLGVPVMVLLLILGPMLLPEYRAPGAGRLAPLDTLLSLASILPLVYGLKKLAAEGWQPVPLSAIAAGLTVGVCFVRRQRRSSDPLLDLRLFSVRSFSASLGILFLGMLTLSALTMYLAQMLQMVNGLGTLEAGLWMLPFVAGTTVGLTLAPTVARRVPPARVIGGGLVLAAAGYAVLTQLDASSGPLLLAVGATVVTVGTGPLMVLGSDLIMSAAPPTRSGSAASLQATSSELGMALGIAVLGSVGTAVYRTTVAGGLPAELSAHTQARAADNLPAATAEAGELPAHLAARVLASAREAFITGFTTVAAISCAVLLVLAVVSFTLLRHVLPSDAGKGRP
jgi:MFS transporter, DHA2 family, multidrug resistance protein